MKDRVAFITGGGGGIGRAIAKSLAQEKVKIVLFGGNNIAKLEETAKVVKQTGGECEIFAGNLLDQTKTSSLFDKAIQTVGKLDILINNAGCAQSTPFEQISTEEFDNIMNLNVRVPFFLTQKALPYLKKSDRASIINIASVVAHAGYPLQSAYTASKHALLGFTKSLASELFDKGIRVHAVSPGGVYTDMVKVSRPDLTPDGMIMPEDIAEIVTFLLKSRTNAVIDEVCVHRSLKQPFLI